MNGCKPSFTNQFCEIELNLKSILKIVLKYILLKFFGLSCHLLSGHSKLRMFLHEGLPKDYESIVALIQ